ncbi:hypothetical protein GRI47_14030 [Erythrobacter pelagi]|uniref:Uncharacterized protein n=1 Tax=Qipengyuania pelagi TaxID=994320 RepID=A0A844YDV9_9SPHN|nr:hypothetical protein [Qipengyuania pelagi]
MRRETPSDTPSDGPERTSDGRYIIVRGRLWRATDPSLGEEERQRWVDALMDARRAVAAAKRADDAEAEKTARAAVHEAKVALGERGPVWWNDGAPDYTRKLVENTPYAQ